MTAEGGVGVGDLGNVLLPCCLGWNRWGAVKYGSTFHLECDLWGRYYWLRFGAYYTFFNNFIEDLQVLPSTFPVDTHMTF